MAFVVLYDANVLYGGVVRDLLIRVALADIVQAKWTSQILDEAFEHLSAKRRDLDPARLRRTRDMMVNAVRDCLVEGYEPLIEGLTLPDAKDRHVLAAAIKAGAQTIVTFNLTDFPEAALQPFGIQALVPDNFVLGLVELDADRVLAAIVAMGADLREQRDRQAMFTVLRKNGFDHTVSELEALTKTS